MTPTDLQPIVAAWGGPEAFARILEVSPRIVYYWLAGKRVIKPPIAKLIRSLQPPAAPLQHSQFSDETPNKLVARSKEPN